MSIDPHAETTKKAEGGGLAFSLKTFSTKFLLATGVSVLIGAVLNVVVAREGIHKLSEESSREIESGLNAASREYLTNSIGDKAQEANYALSHAYADLEIFASLVQDLVDREDELAELHDKADGLPLFQKKLVYNDKSNWYQNEPPDRTTLTVWGYMGDHGKIRPDVQRRIDGTALVDLMMPSFKAHGAKKLQIYYTGPYEEPFCRMAPYTNMGAAIDSAPGSNELNWYDFFYPGLVESWRKWAAEPGWPAGHATQITVTAPYEDAAGGGLVLTAFHPLWSKDRKQFAGMVGLDLTLEQVTSLITHVKLAQTGFAFLTQADGNVLAVNEQGAQTLGLTADTTKGIGVDVLKRYLKDSAYPKVASLELPRMAGADYHDITIDGEPYIIVLERMPEPAQVFKNASITSEHWTLGFVVPRRELYSSLEAAQHAIWQTRTSIVTKMVIGASVSFMVLMLGVYLATRRMTGALVALSRGATRMRKGDYAVRVDVTSEDEVGQLTVAFNDMASEIQAYTTNLEEIVRARTKALEDANQEISELNAALAQENLRLGAELNVARDLQLMVLPPARELRQIPGLDITGYMKPADEVGGDYYDVLRSDGIVKIGIGDVTGHGLESGVLMLMVQTAVRTLLASNEKDPSRFLNIVNKVIYQNAQRINSEKNLTLALMDYSDGVLRLTGQHEEMIVVRSDGRLERVDTTGLGLPVGLELDISEFISNVEVKIEPGDVITLFTDGVTEAEDAERRQYGVERLCKVVLENHTRTSEQIKESIISDVLSHIGDTKIYDDITVLVIKRL